MQLLVVPVRLQVFFKNIMRQTFKITKGNTSTDRHKFILMEN
jgi:hypothetical protein